MAYKRPGESLSSSSSSSPPTFPAKKHHKPCHPATGSGLVAALRLSVLLLTSLAVNTTLALAYICVRPLSRHLYRRVTGAGGMMMMMMTMMMVTILLEVFAGMTPAA